MTPTARARLGESCHEARRRRRADYDRNEPAAMERLRQPALLTDQELRDIVGDWHAGYVREIADQELKRRDGLTAHQRIAEAVRRAE